MTGETGQAALLRPPPIAVHNDGDMPGDTTHRRQSWIVCARAGPMLTMESLAPVSSAIFFT